MNEIDRWIGKNLKDVLQMKDVTIESLSKKTEYSVEEINQMIKGDFGISLNDVSNLSIALSVHYSLLIDGIEFCKI